MIADPAEVFSGEVQNTGTRRDLTNSLILAALILLLLDIALRKLQIPIEPITIFLKEKVIAPIVGVIRSFQKQKPAFAATTAETADHETVLRKQPAEDKNAVKPEKPVATDKSAIKPQKPVAADKSKQGKQSKQKEDTENGSADHVNALLNRRKQWK